MALYGRLFVAQVSLIIVAKPFYAIFCTSCVPHHENPRIIVVVEKLLRHLRDFTELYKNIGEIRRNNMVATLKSDESVWCKQEFIAHKTTTTCCSHRCANLLYKQKKRRLLLRLTTRLSKKSSRRSRLQKSETSLFLLLQKLPHTLE